MSDILALFIRTLRTKPLFRAVFYGVVIGLIVYATNPLELPGFDRFDRGLWIGAYAGLAAFFPRVGSLFALASLAIIWIGLYWFGHVIDHDVHLRFDINRAVTGTVLLIPLVLPELARFIAHRVGPKE